MTELATTIWKPNTGNGEAGQSDNALITTESEFILTTEDGDSLQIEAGSFTPLPATEWIMSEGS